MSWENSSTTAVKPTSPVPAATYRLQLNQAFTFADAAAAVPYLTQLGVSHLYLSPILKARPGSNHGYDVTDHGTLNPELGTLEDFKALAAVARRHGLFILVDVVPNHMAIMADDNTWWLDVLENGPAAEYAGYFDIDWQPIRASMANRLLVPVLGEAYGKVLDKGELKVNFDAATGMFNLCYYEHRFPLDPREYPRIFASHRDELRTLAEADALHVQDFESLLEQFARLPPRQDTSDAARTERYRDKEVYKRRLVSLCNDSPAIASYIEQTVAALNGVPGEADSFEALHALIEAQAYRLAYWRVAGDEINYRRFFDVDHLAAIRMDDPRVFAATHRLLFELIAAGDIHGLRIDHPDGLYDPQTYLEALQREWARHGNEQPLYVVVEKILATHERLPESWPVAGTTGYDFAALVNAWLNNAEGEKPLLRVYRSFVPHTAPYDQIVYDGKKLVMKTLLAAEIAVLSTQLDRLAQQRRHTADFTRYALRDAVTETIACFPVYRSYISSRGVSNDDVRHVDWALQVARKHSQNGDLSVFDFLRQVLLDDTSNSDAAIRTAALEFAMKFQQVSSAVTAKGIEDTAFYRYIPLSSLNEVGGNPQRFSLSSASFHQANAERARLWPYSQLGTSTHDSKRSEDVRARLAVLSEIPDLWRRHLARWSRLNRSKRGLVNNEPAPTRNDEYLLYQTMLGIWPSRPVQAEELEQLKTRLRDYWVKAAREAKDRTSWINPQPAYEQAMQDFIHRIVERPEFNAFLRDFTSLLNIVAYFGALNSLSQAALKLTVPGVPDFYQGAELPQLTLVDPDNRQPIDFHAHRRLLDALTQESSADHRLDFLDELLRDVANGRAKLFVTSTLLRFRAAAKPLFERGKYEALRAQGSQAEHVIAYARYSQEGSAAIVVPRHCSLLSQAELKPPLGNEIWGDTQIELPKSLAGKTLRELFSNRPIYVDESARVDVGTVMSHFPLALLTTQ